MMMMMHVISVYFMFYMQFSPIGLLTYSSTKEKCEKWQFNKCENQTEQWVFFSALWREKEKKNEEESWKERKREVRISVIRTIHSAANEGKNSLQRNWIGLACVFIRLIITMFFLKECDTFIGMEANVHHTLIIKVKKKSTFNSQK